MYVREQTKHHGKAVGKTTVAAVAWAGEGLWVLSFQMWGPGVIRGP